MRKLHNPFSPYILETQVSAWLVDALNASADETLADPGRYRDADFSSQLVGKVSHEISVLIADPYTRDSVVSDLRVLGALYLEHLVGVGAADEWVSRNGDMKPCESGLNLESAWIVSQYKNEYNPCHHHSGDITGIIYTALPDGYQEELDREARTHAPANGHLEFIFGERDYLRINSAKFRPEVGKVFLFPSSLRHFAYPFYCDGERRSVSFNLEITNV